LIWNRIDWKYTYLVVGVVDETRSSTSESVVTAAVEATIRKKFVAAVAATTNLQPAQEGVVWALPAVIDVDASGVGGVGVLADAAAAGAWSDAGGAVLPGGEQRPKCGCT
jgi:hypothetical protein